MTDEEWLKQLRAGQYKWMTDDQWYCHGLFLKLYGGDHHIHGKVHAWGKGIKLNTTTNSLATYDFGNLTSLVFLAHDMCIRAEIVASGPGMIGITLYRREGRKHNNIWGKHPTIESALKSWRKTHESI